MKVREIEAKILEVDGAALRKKLGQIGAKKVFSGKLSSIYFDFPDNGLWKGRKILRLRKEGKRAVLCIKVKTAKSRMKERDEFEIEVSDFSRAERMLKLLGLAEKRRIEKHRTSFRLGNAEIELDKMPGIPLFMEIEAGSAKKVAAIAKRLGFSGKQLLPWNVFEVIGHYSKRH